ncbi:MAG: FTR1 family protein [Blastocatellia bacterium]|nr:FTR1 family protein [Blastocatellia bacterium]
MMNAFIIVLREGFEAFLIVSIVVAYLRKTGRAGLTSAVYAAIGVSVAASAGIGYGLSQATEGVNQAPWEGILGLAAIVLVTTLLFHMRRIAPRMTQAMHERLGEATEGRSRGMAFLGVFLFTVLMITREGMETALLLLQVEGQLLLGGLLGLLGATLLAIAWGRYGHRINMKRFFQVTSLFLVLFLAQIAVYTFHEFAEAGLLPNSDALHAATEVISPDGEIGKWFSLSIVGICASWLIGAWLLDRSRREPAVAVAMATGD